MVSQVSRTRARVTSWSSRATERRTAIVVGIGFVLLVVILSFVAASAGIRGSDQYWYLADVETLIRDGAMVSTTIFPVGLLGPAASLTPPFIHNVLGTYLAAVPGLVVGGYGGWIILNVVATLATAGLIYLSARTVADRWAAAACAVAYPLLPITLWHTAQPLTEPTTAFFAALALYLLAIAGSSAVRWLAIVGAVGLLYYSRESYLPLLLAVPIGFLIVRATEGRAQLRGALLPMVGLSGAVAVLVIVGRSLFGAQNVNFSYTRLVNTAVPGATDNMWFNFDLSSANLEDRLPFRADLLGAKVIGHLGEQFVSFDSLPFALFFWTFNLLSIVALITLWRNRRRPERSRLIVAALTMVAMHFVTIVLFQNQVRYTVPAIPGLLVVSAIALSDVRWLARLAAPRATALIVAVILVGSLPAFVLAGAQRDDAAEFGATERNARALLDSHLASTEPVIVVYVGQPQVLDYAADRRLVLYVSPDYTDREYDRLRAAFPAHWLLAPLGSRAVAGLGGDPVAPVGRVEVSGTDWGLYRLPD